MILISVLVTTALITFAQSTPLSYSMYHRRALETGERPRFSLLFNQIPELENEPFDSSSSRNAAIARPKRIGSLSIVNPLDVLRERVILELARKKMRQDQRQVDANRRLLDNIGKRSSSDSEETRTSNFKDNVDYSIYRMYPSEQRIDESQPLSGVDRNVERTQSWYSGENPTVREAQNQDQVRRMTGELQLL